MCRGTLPLLLATEPLLLGEVELSTNGDRLVSHLFLSINRLEPPGHLLNRMR